MERMVALKPLNYCESPVTQLMSLEDICHPCPIRLISDISLNGVIDPERHSAEGEVRNNIW